MCGTQLSALDNVVIHPYGNISGLWLRECVGFQIFFTKASLSKLLKQLVAVFSRDNQLVRSKNGKELLY